MVRLGDADFAITAYAALPTEQHGTNPRDVGLKRQRLQVEHQLHVIGVARGGASGFLQQRNIRRGGTFRALDLSLDVAYRFEVLVYPSVVARSEEAIELCDAPGERVEDASIASKVRLPRFRVRAIAGSKQALEHGPRVVHHRLRRVRVLP